MQIVKDIRPPQFTIMDLDQELEVMCMLRGLPGNYRDWTENLMLQDLNVSTVEEAFRMRTTNDKKRSGDGSTSDVSQAAMLVTPASSSTSTSPSSSPKHSPKHSPKLLPRSHSHSHSHTSSSTNTASKSHTSSSSKSQTQSHATPSNSTHPVNSSAKHPHQQKRKPAEETYEILCNDTVLSLDMTLAAVRQFVWRQSGELVMYYRRKGVEPGVGATN